MSSIRSMRSRGLQRGAEVHQVHWVHEVQEVPAPVRAGIKMVRYNLLVDSIVNLMKNLYAIRKVQQWVDETALAFYRYLHFWAEGIGLEISSSPHYINIDCLENAVHVTFVLGLRTAISLKERLKKENVSIKGLVERANGKRYRTRELEGVCSQMQVWGMTCFNNHIVNN